MLLEPLDHLVPLVYRVRPERLALAAQVRLVHKVKQVLRELPVQMDCLDPSVPPVPRAFQGQLVWLGLPEESVPPVPLETQAQLET